LKGLARRFLEKSGCVVMKTLCRSQQTRQRLPCPPL
jgi:hypothetical protein